MEDAEFQKKWRMLTLIAVAMLVVAPLVYLFVIYLVKPGLRPTFDEFPTWLYVLYALPIVSIPQYLLLRRVWRKNLNKLVAQSRGLFESFRRLITLRCYTVGASYIYGLFIFFLTGETKQMYYFYTIGILLTPFAWPRKQEYLDFVQEAKAP
jgi:hypothetical protein